MICQPRAGAVSWGMPTLTRRRQHDRHQECWQIYFGDVCVGTIGERAGVPVEVDQWGWHCGFAPAIDGGLRAGGTAASLEQARAAFATALECFLNRTGLSDDRGDLF